MSFLYDLNNIEQYYEGKRVLNIKKLQLNQNEIVGFFGPNGSGKSTLFSILSFITAPTSGSLKFDGKLNEKIDLQTRKEVVMVPQNPYLLKRTVFENIAYGLKIRKQKGNINQKVEEALKLVGLDISFAKRNWNELSGGEAQRVSLAARLILKPKVLILDEPTTGVDTNSAQLIKEAILSVKRLYGTTIFISSHDHGWLNNICDRKVALFKGKLVESDSVNLLFAPWDRDENGNLIKFFIDGQNFVIPQSNDKTEDEVIMLDANDIKIFRSDHKEMFNEATLIGTVSSIHQQHGLEHLCVDFDIGSISFNSRLTREEMQEQRFLPGDRVYVNIDTKNICYI